MSSPEVLEAMSTASGSTTPGYDIVRAVKGSRRGYTTSATQSYGAQSVTGMTYPSTLVIDRLLREEAHAALSGTFVFGNPSSWWPSKAILLRLLTAGIGHGTQYLLRVESEDLPWSPKALVKSPNVEELTRRALDLSGLTRDQLATAMGVKRQSVQNWLGARGMSPENRKRLQELITLFERAHARFEGAKQVSEWITRPVREDGPTPLEMLKDSRIDAVKGRLLRRTPVGGTALSPTSSRGVLRRTGPVGYGPPWARASRSPEFDPEEGEAVVIDEGEELYRDVRPGRVTGLARA